MATTETNHPIQAWIKRAIKHGGPPHMSNLGNLVKHYPEYIQPDKMEHISAYIRPPWWMPTITTAISTANKDEAAKAHQKRLHQIPTQDLIIYNFTQMDPATTGTLERQYTHPKLTTQGENTLEQMIHTTSMRRS